jgi:hypothetical protein
LATGAAVALDGWSGSPPAERVSAETDFAKFIVYKRYPAVCTDF